MKRCDIKRNVRVKRQTYRIAASIFRHTFATNCYYKGVDIKILSKLLGHADTNITYNIYVSLYGDGFDEMYNALTK